MLQYWEQVDLREDGLVRTGISAVGLALITLTS